MLFSIDPKLNHQNIMVFTVRSSASCDFYQPALEDIVCWLSQEMENAVACQSRASGVRSVFESMTAHATEISTSGRVSCMTFVEISLLKVNRKLMMMILMETLLTSPEAILNFLS
ncbi:uncharacterized protein LOC115738173 [Rhodamnia argentea]|uniref:Uncharacterized protein LOC115738173 n=1 Tax=Rhodamnia argentea TaxID=178133 RepID=A0A8B8NVL1_9MYRT|nr:uncharacterized protein LOC115738173 [Rhodamnia argentea]